MQEKFQAGLPQRQVDRSAMLNNLTRINICNNAKKLTVFGTSLLGIISSLNFVVG